MTLGYKTKEPEKETKVGPQKGSPTGRKSQPYNSQRTEESECKPK